MIKLPIGVQSFAKLRKQKYAYVDKTRLIFKLVSEGEAYFLARPRRFGKSLLVSTLEAFFRGQRELFSDLWIDSIPYDWKEHPVISLDFSRLISSSPEALMDSLQELLQEVANEYGLGDIRKPYPSQTLAMLITELVQRNPVVILIDEHDKPLVSHLDDMTKVAVNREALRDFFVVIKALDKHLRHVLVTGVSKFSQVSLFSGMNNLRDITLNKDYGTLLGLTERELDSDFAELITAAAQARGETSTQTRELMRQWYNGYRFGRSADIEKVYNPLSTMLFLTEGELSNYWFSTATPTFAIRLLREKQYPIANFEESITGGREIELSHDVDTIDLHTLLLQTGYLTITSYNEQLHQYRLEFPNEEVRRSFLEHLFQGFLESRKEQAASSLFKLSTALKDGDLQTFFDEMNDLLASIPYEIQVPLEAYYHSLLYLMVRLAGFPVEAEVSTSRGRIDMLVEHPDSILLFEFKIGKSAQEALDQIHTRGYFERYRTSRKRLVLVGANFDPNTRSMDDWISKEL